MKRILVTGASGWIGGHCLELLARGTDEVHAVSSRARQPSPESAGHGSVIWHSADLLDAAGRSRLIATVQPTHLLHLAWFVGPGYRDSPVNWDWLAASVDLVGLFAASGGRRFVGAGTCLEYDWTKSHCEERFPARLPNTPYGRAKLWLGSAAARICEEQGASAAWGRIFFSFGPGERDNRLVPDVIRGLLANRDVACSAGNQVRDFLYVVDLAAAFVALLASEVSGPVNMAGGHAVSIRSLIEEIAAQIPSDGRVRFGARPTAGDDALPILTADTSRLAREAGWTPSLDMPSAIAETVRWWRREL